MSDLSHFFRDMKFSFLGLTEISLTNDKQEFMTSQVIPVQADLEKTETRVLSYFKYGKVYLKAEEAI